MRHTLKVYEPNKKTFKEGYEEYVLDMKARNLRDGTLKHYKESVKQIFKRLPPSTPICEMNEQTVNNFFVSLHEDKALNDVSIGTYSRDLKTLLRFFMRQGYLPHFEINIPKADIHPIETYTDEELIKLLKKPNLKTCKFGEYRSWVIICLLLSTGMRQNSIINLKVRDVDFDNNYIHINITKNRKPLIIPLNEDMMTIFKEYMVYRKGKEDDWLFCNIFGDKLTRSTCYHCIYEYCHSHGVETTGVHRFRHTFAKKWVMMNGSLAALQKMLGHSSLNITEQYIHLLTTDLAKSVQEINILRELNPQYISMKKKKGN